MDVGIMVEGQEGLDWERWRRIARKVEQLGLDSLWRSDHFFSFGRERSRPSLETLVSLAVLAAESRRITFGPLVCSMTFRHPSVLARMAAHIDQLSGGRLVLGLGAGWNTAEHEAYGIPFPPMRERMDRLEEGTELTSRLLGGGPVSLEGRHYSLREAHCEPRPERATPILIGGGGEKRTLRVAARFAAEWNSVALSLEQYRHKRQVLERHCESVGRDPGEIRHSMMMWLITGGSENEVDQSAARVGSMFPGLGGQEARQIRQTLKGRGWPVGLVPEVVEHLARLGEAGVSRIMVQHTDYDNDQYLDFVAQEIAPAIR